MNRLLSVIVPVYNVERYLEQCIESILQQSYANLEIILVDDGSTDNSGQICDLYANKDCRIKVFHQKNAGAANAKNSGLKIARGEYLAFVDSDDYLETGAYEYMILQLKKHQADVIQCSFRNVYVDKHEEKIQLYEYSEFTTADYLKRFTHDWTCGLLWDKLYRRELFEGIYFEEGHKIDDEFFTYQGIMNAKKIIHSPRIVYNYRLRKSGVMLSKTSQRQILMDKLDYLSKRRKNVAQQFPELKKEFDYHFLNMLVILSTDDATTEESIMEVKRLLNCYFKEDNWYDIEWSLKWQLLKLKFLQVESILKNKNQVINDQNLYQYFE